MAACGGRDTPAMPTTVALIVTASILAYQVVIASLVVCAGVIFGRTGTKWAAIIAALWTLTHVIFPPLMCLQFVTIGGATALSFALAGRHPSKGDGVRAAPGSPPPQSSPRAADARPEPPPGREEAR